MTTYAENDSTTTTTATSWPLFAALGAGTALVLTAVGTFWDITGNDTGEPYSITDYLPVVAVVLVATAVVFGLVVRTASPASAGTRSVVLAVLGLLSVVVFWSGLPAVLAFGAVALAMVARGAAGVPGSAKVALGISTLTLVLAVYSAIAG